MTLEQLLLNLANKQLETKPELGNVVNAIKEFQHAPWNYKVFGPISLDDSPSIHIYLSVGKVHKAYDIVLNLDLETMTISMEEVNTPSVKTLKGGSK